MFMGLSLGPQLRVLPGPPGALVGVPGAPAVLPGAVAYPLLGKTGTKSSKSEHFRIEASWNQLKPVETSWNQLKPVETYCCRGN